MRCQIYSMMYLQYDAVAIYATGSRRIQLLYVQKAVSSPFPGCCCGQRVGCCIWIFLLPRTAYGRTTPVPTALFIVHRCSPCLTRLSKAHRLSIEYGTNSYRF